MKNLRETKLKLIVRLILRSNYNYYFITYYLLLNLQSERNPFLLYESPNRSIVLFSETICKATIFLEKQRALFDRKIHFDFLKWLENSRMTQLLPGKSLANVLLQLYLSRIVARE